MGTPFLYTQEPPHCEEKALEMPVQVCQEASLLTEAECHQLLISWNATRTAYPRNRCIHQVFAEQVARYPAHIAITYAEQSLTYEELDQRADQLAHTLQCLGVGLETRVGICMERSLEVVIALLAILKAGGAYVPLDPNYPQERLAFFIEDAEVAVLLTQTWLTSRLPASRTRIVCLDQPLETVTQKPMESCPDLVQPENLAYIMYTSGSTGKPKGVAVTHRNVVRLVKETNYLPFTHDQVFLQFSSISFDASTLEIWGGLLNGARLVIAPPALPSLEELGALVQRSQINTLFLTTGLFQVMVENHVDALRSLKYLVTGGDVLSVAAAQRAVQELPACCILNGYGPTESTTFATCYRLHDSASIRTSVPIGRPISNTQVYVLDGNLQPVPIGVAGELFIGGDGVARGYLNRPELTREKFLPDPFSQETEARMYRTGDLVRYRVDGTLEFLGRSDNQVKVRGFRVELNEIEAVLGMHPLVRSCVVLARVDAQGQKQLVAYLNLSQEHATAIEAVRTYLQQQLPAYMLPAVFVPIEQFPLTPNGKVDRQALPDPAVYQTDIASVGPRDALEAVLGEIWLTLLGWKQVAIDAPFLESGGNSLLAMQLTSYLLKVFHTKIPLQSFFQKLTVADLAQTLRERETHPGQALKIAQTLQRIKQMTPEERRQALAEKRQKRGVR